MGWPSRRTCGEAERGLAGEAAWRGEVEPESAEVAVGEGVGGAGERCEDVGDVMLDGGVPEAGADVADLERGDGGHELPGQVVEGLDGERDVGGWEMAGDDDDDLEGAGLALGEGEAAYGLDVAEVGIGGDLDGGCLGEEDAAVAVSGLSGGEERGEAGDVGLEGSEAQVELGQAVECGDSCGEGFGGVAEDAGEVVELFVAVVEAFPEGVGVEGGELAESRGGVVEASLWEEAQAEDGLFELRGLVLVGVVVEEGGQGEGVVVMEGLGGWPGGDVVGGVVLASG